MKIRTDVMLQGLGGEELMPLKEVLQNVLIQDHDPKNVQESVRRYNLAKEVTEKEEVEVTSEDITMLKKSVVALYKPLVSGQTCLILEGGCVIPAKDNKEKK